MYGDAILAQTIISRKFEPIAGDYKTRLCNKSSKRELDDVTKNPEEWITELEFIREDLRKLDLHIDDS